MTRRRRGRLPLEFAQAGCVISVCVADLLMSIRREEVRITAQKCGRCESLRKIGHPPPVDRRFDSRAWLRGCNHLDYEMLSTHGEGRGISSDLRAHGVEMIQSDDGEW